MSNQQQVYTKPGAIEMATPENIDKLSSLINSFTFAMVTTIDKENNSLHSRPMALLKDKSSNSALFVGNNLWFFTYRHCNKTDELSREPCMSVTMQSSSTYLSLVGKSAVIDDRIKIRELWQESFKTWFPGGIDDPELCLIRFNIEGAEYWDMGGLSTWRIRIGGFLKSVLTGEAPQPTADESKKIQMGHKPIKQTMS